MRSRLRSRSTILLISLQIEELNLYIQILLKVSQLIYLPRSQVFVQIYIKMKKVILLETNNLNVTDIIYYVC